MSNGTREFYSQLEQEALVQLAFHLQKIEIDSTVSSIFTRANELPLQFVPNLAPHGAELVTKRGALLAEFFDRKPGLNCSIHRCKEIVLGFHDIMVSV